MTYAEGCEMKDVLDNKISFSFIYIENLGAFQHCNTVFYFRWVNFCGYIRKKPDSCQNQNGFWLHTEK